MLSTVPPLPGPAPTASRARESDSRPSGDNVPGFGNYNAEGTGTQHSERATTLTPLSKAMTRNSETAFAEKGDISTSQTHPSPSSNGGPRILVIGAGSRGNAYARAIAESTNGIVAAVAEPIASKRQELGRRYIWGETGQSGPGQEFEDWAQFLEYEEDRRRRKARGEDVPEGVDGVLVCVLDELHKRVITGLAHLELHVLSEKPLATTLGDCLDIWASLRPKKAGEKPRTIFAIGHVLRYSPHNMLLRKLLLEDNVIGDIISIEHTEPVGWWHFSHSYVRGNWRKESSTAPSLLTKSCHDIDFILWLLCSPPPHSREPAHLPARLTSTGSLVYFRKSNKPPLAANATNCLSCPAEQQCIYSAKKIYLEKQLQKGNADWPVNIVDPEIEDLFANQGPKPASKRLLERLAEDYDTPSEEADRRPWFGRCVYESANDVCDDQNVIINWDEDRCPSSSTSISRHRGPKTAIFHMVAFTEAQCERRGRVYGTRGEIEYDSRAISVFTFGSGEKEIHYPPQPGGGHGGGDDGLATQFIRAIDAVKDGGMSVETAQREHIGCDIEEMIRSHAMVFAAEEARVEKKVVGCHEWWIKNMGPNL
ncbi:MAG: hypothetical protein M1819_003971 [Sarea resinae]|nr:MAG: hypothetical protein M1819_003971 [Sarea resinae]